MFYQTLDQDYYYLAWHSRRMNDGYLDNVRLSPCQPLKLSASKMMRDSVTAWLSRMQRIFALSRQAQRSQHLMQ